MFRREPPSSGASRSLLHPGDARPLRPSAPEPGREAYRRTGGHLPGVACRPCRLDSGNGDRAEVTDAGVLVPIEPHVRDEDPLDDVIVVIRAGPLTVEKLVEHATASKGGIASAVGRWHRPASTPHPRGGSRPSSGTACGLALRMRRVRWELCAGAATSWSTFDAPHYDVLLPAASAEVAGSLLSLFGDPRSNPYKRRRR